MLRDMRRAERTYGQQVWSAHRHRRRGQSSVVGVCTHAPKRQVSVAPGTDCVCVCVCVCEWSMQQRCTLTVPARTHPVRRATERERDREEGRGGEDNDDRLKHSGGRVLRLLLVVLATVPASVADRPPPPYMTLQIAANQYRYQIDTMPRALH